MNRIAILDMRIGPGKHVHELERKKNLKQYYYKNSRSKETEIYYVYYYYWSKGSMQHYSFKIITVCFSPRKPETSISFIISGVDPLTSSFLNVRTVYGE
jgi:hypothetical protein